VNSDVNTGEGYRLVRLANGVSSIHALAERETFHPVVGPAAEAEALYVRQLRLQERLAAMAGGFVVWDVGLGAAANALAAIRAAALQVCSLRILSFDRTLEPLRFGLGHAAELGYYGGFESSLRELLAAGRVQLQTGRTTVDWELHLGDFPTLIGAPAAVAWAKPHAILFDAFSPARNPSMWTLGLFSAIHRLLDPATPCALATYSRSTLLRVSLLVAGFYVGAGRATGEKDQTTIAANTPELLDDPLDRRWLGRARRSTSAEPLPSARYRQAPLSAATWDRLLAHPQFR